MDKIKVFECVLIWTLVHAANNKASAKLDWLRLGFLQESPQEPYTFCDHIASVLPSVICSFFCPTQKRDQELNQKHHHRACPDRGSRLLSSLISFFLFSMILQFLYYLRSPTGETEKKLPVIQLGWSLFKMISEKTENNRTIAEQKP